MWLEYLLSRVIYYDLYKMQIDTYFSYIFIIQFFTHNELSLELLNSIAEILLEQSRSSAG